MIHYILLQNILLFLVKQDWFHQKSGHARKSFKIKIRTCQSTLQSGSGLAKVLYDQDQDSPANPARSGIKQIGQAVYRHKNSMTVVIWFFAHGIKSDPDRIQNVMNISAVFLCCGIYNITHPICLSIVFFIDRWFLIHHTALFRAKKQHRRRCCFLKIKNQYSLKCKQE